MKSSKTNKILCLILAISMSVIASGCVGGRGEDSGTFDSQKESAEATDTYENGESQDTEDGKATETQADTADESESSESSESEESSESTEGEIEAPVADGHYIMIDVAKEASSAPLTREIIQDQLNAYAKAGYKQVWILPTADTYAVKESCQGSVVCDPSIETDYMHKSVHATLDPTLSYIMAAKNAGLEVTVVYRPYESGGSVTIPRTASAQFSFAYRNTVGGKAVFCSEKFGLSNSNYICSANYAKGVNEAGRPYTLEMVFAAEDFENGGEMIAVDSSSEIKPVLWVTTDDNINYVKKDNVSFDVTEETRAVTDANGNVIGEMKCRVLRMDVSGYSTSRYFAVTLENGNSLYTVPFSMISCYDKTGMKLNTTCAIFARNPYSDDYLGVPFVPNNYFWGSERKPIKTTEEKILKSFPAFGFEFQYGGVGADRGDGWQNGYAYGLTVGTKSHLGGNLCEVIEGVREYWLGLVDRYYAMGADEVVISLENHGGMVYDYTNYGFNGEIVKAYSDKYGVNILEEEFDYLKLMEIRGEFFMEFIKEAKKTAEKRGAKLGVELIAAFEAPELDDDINGLCYYKMPKIVFDWREALTVCDSVLIADRVFGEYDGTIADGIRAEAKKQGKRVTVAAYESLGADSNYITVALCDADNSGVVLIK